ncbi:MAG: hypothetical protein R3212_10135, partial [Xanthomonadales bacterium]|nr:hypothetical protein [Xanthomonadales bacterium]
MQNRTSMRLIVTLAGLIALSAVPAARAGEGGLMYAISSDGDLRGYLLGTVHSDDPRVLRFSPEFLEA